MELTLSYGTKMRSGCSAMNAMCKQTCSVLASAVAFFADICEKHWAGLRTATQFDAMRFLEKVCHATAGNTPMYPFDMQFPNFLSYLSRDTIASAFGAVKGYHSNLANWEDSGQNGSQLVFPSFGKDTPSMHQRIFLRVFAVKAFY